MQNANINITISEVKEIDFMTSISLAKDIIISYTLYLPEFIAAKSDLIKLLDPEELSKTERFHNEKDKNRFAITRSILKIILAAYSKTALKNIHIDYHSNKKPFLRSNPLVHFNVSHSKDYAVIAISETEVGIDIEYMSNDFDFSSLLPDVFEDHEISQIQNATDKKHAFYTSWTRKEAFAKATGIGIDDDFRLLPSLEGRHFINSNLIKNNKNWLINSFMIDKNYTVALAFENVPSISRNLVFALIPNTVPELLEKMQDK